MSSPTTPATRSLLATSALDASFAHHFAQRAFYLTLWRILRWQPFAKAGYDPVLEKIAGPQVHNKGQS